MEDSTFWYLVANIYLAAAVIAPKGEPDGGFALLISGACFVAGWACK